MAHFSVMKHGGWEQGHIRGEVIAGNRARINSRYSNLESGLIYKVNVLLTTREKKANKQKWVSSEEFNSSCRKKKSDDKEPLKYAFQFCIHLLRFHKV